MCSSFFTHYLELSMLTDSLTSGCRQKMWIAVSFFVMTCCHVILRFFIKRKNMYMINWYTDVLIYWMTDWLIERLIEKLIYWWIDWLTDWLIDWLTDRQTDWLTGWLTDYLTNKMTYMKDKRHETKGQIDREKWHETKAKYEGENGMKRTHPLIEMRRCI